MKLDRDVPLSNVAFKFKLRLYMLAQTPSAIARINLAAPPNVDALTPTNRGKRRRRNKGGNNSGGGGGGKGGAGQVKVANLDNPCLFLGYFAPGQALLVERPWADVLKTIPEPLYRHRFGA